MEVLIRPEPQGGPKQGEAKRRTGSLLPIVSLSILLAQGFPGRSRS